MNDDNPAPLSEDREIGYLAVTELVTPLDFAPNWRADDFARLWRAVEMFADVAEAARRDLPR